MNGITDGVDARPNAKCGIAAIALVSALVACGNGSTNNRPASPSPTPSPGGGTATITIANNAVSAQSVTVSASDAHSGLASDSVQNGASVTLDTSSIGPAMASVTAKDKVGHTTTSAPCNYSVAYGFVGFLAPINGDAVNSGKTGRTYPIKWRLNRDDGTGNLVPISRTP